MKKTIIILLIIMFSSTSFCHEQPMHQYITREAWQLLLKSFPELQYTEMANYIGYAQTNSNQNLKSMGDGKVVSGAWIEDEYDILYHYGVGRQPEFNQSVTPELYSIFLETAENKRQSFTSITHFWDADAGYNSGVGLSDYASGIYWSFNIPENAYQKLMKYYMGMYDLRLVYNTPTAHSGCGTIYGLWWDIGVRDNLANYCNNSLLFESVQYFAGEVWLPADCYIAPFYKEWVYEILGRMVHLLQDMSVPAHVQCVSHAGTNGMYQDYYETNASSFHQWTANEIYTNGDTFIDPYQQNWGHPLAYLMYFLNQITDHYGTGKTYGDFLYDASCPGISEYVVVGDLPQLPSQINWTNCSSMHDKLQPLAIRATAGLLYWFARETGFLPDPISNATIDGSRIIIKNKPAYWGISSTEDGVSPFDYQWQVKKVDNIYSLLLIEKFKKDKKDKKDKDDIIIFALPSNQWVTVGLNEDYLSLTGSPSDPRDLYVRCLVTDNTNTTVTSNSIFVEYSESDLPPSSSFNSNNKEFTEIVNSLSKASAEFSQEENNLEIKLGNHPNPFNPTTTITYSLPLSEHVTIKVFNTLGMEVASLVDGIIEAGSHQVNLNASNLSSGMYIYTIQTPSFFKSKKMILMK
ncbi:MAG: T9SS type A sorting domain-containing protein [Bacteroidetes bacterium]|nr:T9SS type A sorting domain-containing protein [Bacteroidota bacterium]